jgi:hypothetical protein
MSEEKKEDTLGASMIPEAPDPVAKADADKVRVLVKLDIAKFEMQRIRAMQMVSDCDLAIAQQKLLLADLDRREANVGLPENAKPEEEPKKEEAKAEA